MRFDNRDVGLSSHLDHLGSPNIALATLKYLLRLPLKAAYLIDDMARDTAALLDALGIPRAHVVGASMGGMIAQNLAANAPAKVASLTSIMSDRQAQPPQPTSKARRALLRAPAKPGDVEGATRQLMSVLRDIGSQTHPAEEGYPRPMRKARAPLVRPRGSRATAHRRGGERRSNRGRSAYQECPHWCCMETRIRWCARPAAKKRRA